jgi:hypothetical protein
MDISSSWVVWRRGSACQAAFVVSTSAAALLAMLLTAPPLTQWCVKVLSAAINKQTNKQTNTLTDLHICCVHPFLMLSSLRCVGVHHVLYPLPVI